MSSLDGDGEPLDGSRRYEIRLPEPPPVGAFWSPTMYGLPDFYLIDNAIVRYSIGNRTPGPARACDGSPTVAIARELPPITRVG